MKFASAILSSFAIALTLGANGFAFELDDKSSSNWTVETKRQRVGNKEVAVVLSRVGKASNLTVLIVKAVDTPRIYYNDLQVAAFDRRGRKIALRRAKHEPAWLGEAGSSAGVGANAIYGLLLDRSQDVAKVSVTFERRRKLFFFNPPRG